MNQTWVPFVLCAGVVLIFAAVVALIFRNDRRAKEARRQMIQALGFTPVATPEPGLAEAIFHLHRLRVGTNLKLENLAHLRRQEDELFYFDLWDMGSESSSIVDGGIALRSPRLGMPRFSLIPQIPGSGKMTQAANWMLEKIYTRYSVLILSFPDTPEFEERFKVLTVDPEEEVRAFLTAPLRQRLASFQNIQVMAGENMFTLEWTETSLPRQNPQAKLEKIEKVRRLVRDAGYLADLFEDARAAR